MQTLVENVFNSPARVRVFSHNGVDFLFFFLFLCLKGGPPPSRFLTCFCRTAGHRLARSAGLRCAVCLRDAANGFLFPRICSPLAEARV